MLPNFSINNCKEADCSAVANIEKQCFSQPWTEEGVLSAVLQDNTVFLTARSEGEVVGYISFQYVLDEGYINNIAVAPGFRRCGIGKELLKEVIIQGKQRSLSFLTLEVRPSNIAAVDLYVSLGFREVGRRKNFYSDPAEDALLLTYRYDEN